MIRQLFTASAPSARLACPATTAPLKTQITRSTTWHLTPRTTPSTPLTTRPFSSTPPTHFTASPSKPNNSPFRLSTDKQHASSTPPSEELEDQYSAYKPKRQWPPDMSKLSPKHQFRLERKYRRRAALKYARPKFIKGVTLAQWVIIGFVAVYAVLFMDWDTRGTPFDGIRESVFSAVRAVFTTPPPPGPVKRDEKN